MSQVVSVSVPEVALIVLRHGATTWSAEGRFTGHLDPPLSQQGSIQARAAALALGHRPICRILSSDLQRARHTADFVAEAVGLPVHLDERLREEHLGDWEGLTAAEVACRFPDSYARWQRGDISQPFDGREGLAAVGRRMLAAVHDAARDAPASTHASGATILLVTHINATVALAGILGGLDPQVWPDLPGLRPGSWITFNI
jgi:glucosyl-3-phosphoglycerate phosphatase